MVRKAKSASREEPVADPHLVQYRTLVRLLQNRVRTVAHRYQTGAYIVGRPGTGKTHTVRSALEQLSCDWVYVNGKISPAALFDTFAERIEGIVVLDDVSTLFENNAAAEILMAAIGGEAGSPREIKYVTRNLRREAAFSGGIVAISNRPLRHDHAGRALASRLVLLEFEPTDEMIAAYIRDSAAKGTKTLDPKECTEVCEYVIEECRAAKFRLDLRAYFKGLNDYACWKSEECEVDWRELIKTSLNWFDPTELDPGPSTRLGTKELEYEIVQELAASGLDAKTAAEEWSKRTGKSVDSYYRRKRELRL